jgi:hypothetical protein
MKMDDDDDNLIITLMYEVRMTFVLCTHYLSSLQDSDTGLASRKRSASPDY